MFIFFTLVISIQGNASNVRCPNVCKCRLLFDPEDGAVLRVQCLNGDMNRIPIDDIDRSVYKLVIGAPKNRQNHLTIGPIFTHPAPFLELREIHIVNSNVPSIGKHSFWGLQNLKVLNLTYNNLTSIGMDNFRGLINLSQLYLSHNHIENMPSETFRHCTSLKMLNLAYNHISVLMPRLFRMLAKLQTLDLNYVFGQNRELEVLNLAYNRLALLSPNSLTNLTKLLHLDISHNKIERFDLQTFAPVVETLRIINFSGNNMPLNEVAILLQILPDLNGVGLANLSLPEIPPNFFIYNEHLVALDLSWNKLNRFPLKLLSKAKFLQRLDISHNHLTKLEEPDLQRLEAIPEILLSKNRWHCDQCSAGMMLVYMSTTVLNGSLRNLRCYSPMRLRGTLLANMSFDSLEVCPTSHEAQMSVIAGLVLVLVAALAAVTGALCCTRRRAQRYYTNEEKRLERDHEHPDELLPHTELGTLATIHAPYHAPGEHS
ncbi:Leucine-rich transmembrane protein, partial [Operophtera brumata]